jgi:hypothetical protein
LRPSHGVAAIVAAITANVTVPIMNSLPLLWI